MTTTTPPPKTGLRAWERAEAAGKPLPPLTPRQLQVLQGLADGQTYDEIARELYVTTPTVKVHAGLLFDRLRARCAAHAVAIGYRNGLLPGPTCATTQPRQPKECHVNPIPRGTIRIDLAEHVNHLGAVDVAARTAIRAWIDKGTDLGALIDLGPAQHVPGDIVIWLAEVTIHALAVDIVGDNPDTVGQLIRDLPGAYRLVRSWDEAA